VAAPTVEATTGSVERANVSSDTITTHSITSANRLVAVVTIGTAAPNLINVNGITWNGTALSSVIEKDDANFELVSIWELASPAAGTFNAICSLNSSVQQFGWCVSGVLNVDSVRAGVSTSGTSDNPSLTVTNSQADDLIFAGLASDIGSIGTTTPAGTQLYELENVGGGDSDFNVQSVASAGTNQVASWTSASTGSGWAAAAYALVGAAGGALVTQEVSPLFIMGMG